MPKGPGGMFIELFRFGAGCLPVTTQGFEAGANAHAFAKNLPRDRGRVIIERVEDPKFEGIQSQENREIVIELFLRDGHLRYAKPAKCTSKDEVGMNGAREGSILRNHVRYGSVHWNPRRDRWPPGRICARIEVGGEVER